MRAKTLLGYLFLLFSMMALSGCTKPLEAVSKIGQVILDPSIPIGPPQDRPSTISLTILAEPNINPNQDGEATPLNLQIVYMNEDSLFAALDFDQIEEKDGDLEKVLKKTISTIRTTPFYLGNTSRYLTLSYIQTIVISGSLVTTQTLITRNGKNC